MPDIVGWQDQCRICHRPATKLCDYVVGRWVSPHMVVKHGANMTCDMPLCDQCAVELFNGFDVCPEHARAIKEKLMGRNEL